MAQFAIVRHDGQVDLAEGTSVNDVASRYGWPGNGDIEEYSPARHPTIRHQFKEPADQLAEWQKVHDAEVAATAPPAPPSFGSGTSSGGF